MRYRLMATYLGVPYHAGLGPDGNEATLFSPGPPPDELGFVPAGGHWRKQVNITEPGSDRAGGRRAALGRGADQPAAGGAPRIHGAPTRAGPVVEHPAPDGRLARLARGRALAGSTA